MVFLTSSRREIGLSNPVVTAEKKTRFILVPFYGMRSSNFLSGASWNLRTFWLTFISFFLFYKKLFLRNIRPTTRVGWFGRVEMGDVIPDSAAPKSYFHCLSRTTIGPSVWIRWPNWRYEKLMPAKRFRVTLLEWTLNVCGCRGLNEREREREREREFWLHLAFYYVTFVVPLRSV